MSQYQTFGRCNRTHTMAFDSTHFPDELNRTEYQVLLAEYRCVNIECGHSFLRIATLEYVGDFYAT